MTELTNAKVAIETLPTSPSPVLSTIKTYCLHSADEKECCFVNEKEVIKHMLHKYHSEDI